MQASSNANVRAIRRMASPLGIRESSCSRVFVSGRTTIAFQKSPAISKKTLANKTLSKSNNAGVALICDDGPVALERRPSTRLPSCPLIYVKEGLAHVLGVYS
jgi:hypothetical protein